MKRLTFDQIWQLATINARLHQLGEQGGPSALQEVASLHTPELLAQRALVERDPSDLAALQGLEYYLLGQAQAGENVRQVADLRRFDQTIEQYGPGLHRSLAWHTWVLRLRQVWRKVFNGNWVSLAQPQALRGSLALTVGLLLLLGANFYLAPGAVIDAHMGGLPSAQLAGRDRGAHPGEPTAPASLGASPVRLLYDQGDLAGTTLEYASGGSTVAEDHLLAGTAYLQLGQAPQAVAALEQAAATAGPPARDQAQYYLVFAYLAAGQPGEAAQLLEQIRQDPHFTFRKKQVQDDLLYVKVRALDLLP
jgi:tetratricopeptide (TPR) repeat protein